MNDNIYQSELLFQNQRIQELEKELEVHKKALQMACAELESDPYSQWNQQEWHSYFLQKARDNE